MISFFQNQYSSEAAKKYGLYGGVGYYRQIKPAQFLKRWYDVKLTGKEFLNVTDMKVVKKKIVNIVKESDLVWVKHLDKPDAIVYLLGACSFYDKPLIVDFDDHVFTTDGLSPERFVYPDGSDEKHYTETLLNNCTAISVSVPALVSVYEKYKPTHVCGNYVDPASWDVVNKKHDDGRMTIGWVGSASHVVDHDYIIPVFQEIVRRYPNVVFSFMGHMKPEWIAGLLPKGNWSVTPGIGWWEGNPEDPLTYPQHLASQGYDIGLAPLIHSQFNACRSATKWMEYSMLGIPTIGENWGPYKDQNVLLGNPSGEKAWVEAISELIESKTKRKKYGKLAKERVLADYAYPAGVAEWRAVCDRYIGKGFAPA